MNHARRSNSCSEEDDRYADEKKRKRRISNRESAKRSRMKRQLHMQDLNNQIMFYKKKRNEMIQNISNFTQQFMAAETENRILRVQKEELGKRLESAELVLSYLDTAKGYTITTAEDPWLKPWQPPSQSMPIITSAGFFQF